MLVRELMSAPATILRPEDSLRTAVRLFKASGLEGIAVVDAGQAVVGIFTKSQLFECLLESVDLEEPVGRFMRSAVVTVPSETPFSEVSEEVRTTTVGQAVVTTGEGKFLGMLTKVDVIRGLLAQSDHAASEFASVVNAMDTGLVAVDADGRVTLVNPAAEHLLGLHTDRALRQDVAAVWPECDLMECLRKGETLTRRKQTAHRTLLTRTSPVRCDRRVVGALALIQDLTSYEQVAQELETVKQLHGTLATILEIAYDAIVVCDEGGVVTMVNGALCHFLGRKEEEILGRHVTEVLENTRLHLVARSGVPEIGQIQLMRGQQYIVSRLPIVKEGRVVGAVGKIMFRGLVELREVARRLGALETQVAYYKEELSKVGGTRYTLGSIITSNPRVEALKREAAQAARSQSTVLLLGASGTGKELFAHSIHAASQRRTGPFLKVNCAAVPENLLESEFFGYMEGAFTGARKGGKPGKFELADGGTIFLDEIGDMSTHLQAKLLRVLQDREFERVGATQTVRVDVRVIAASNRDLKGMVATGKFREDLYYRLNVVCLEIPPLRERKEDILPLAHFLLGRFNKVMGTKVGGVSPEALAVLQAYDWPGNVRELENVIERAMNLDVADLIRPEHLPGYLVSRGRGAKGSDVIPYRESVGRAECQAILDALAQTGGNKAKAARLLGLSRSRLYEKLKVYDLKR